MFGLDALLLSLITVCVPSMLSCMSGFVVVVHFVKVPPSTYISLPQGDGLWKFNFTTFCLS